MAVVEANEVVNVVLSVAAVPVLIAAANRLGMNLARRLFIVAYLLMIAGYVSTVIETFVLPDVFNVLEHVSYASSGVVFLLAVLHLEREAPWNERSL